MVRWARAPRLARPLLVALLAQGVGIAAAEDDLIEVCVAAGRHFSIFVDAVNGTAFGMGRNNYGQLGIGNTADRNEPTEVQLPDGVRVSGAAAGRYHSLFLLESGEVYVTGSNRFGQLARSTSDVDNVQVPDKMNLGSDGDTAVSVAAGYAHSLILLASGKVLSVGYNAYGQLGDSTMNHRSTLYEAFTNAKAIAAGFDFSVFLTEAGDVWACGNNLGGQLGDGSRTTRLSAVSVLGGVAGVAAGHSHTIFLMQDGAVRGTGANFVGQLGTGDAESQVTPVDMLAADAHLVAAGGDSSAFVKTNGRLSVTGDNYHGQIGLADTVSTLTPVQDSQTNGHTLAAAISTSHSLRMSTLDHGTLFASGGNSFGELGVGDTAERRVAVVVSQMPIPGVTTSTPAPTPVPTPAPTFAPTPEVIREPEGNGMDWLLYAGVGGGVVAAAAFFFLRSRGQNPAAATDTAAQSGVELLEARGAQA